MIVKHFEFGKINFLNNRIFLLYGENEGLKNEVIKKNLENKFLETTYRYDESEILKNKEEFFMNLYSQSFFENKKLIVISRVTEKIKDIIEDMDEKKLIDVVIVLLSGTLDRKSKIRQLFEKSKVLTCIPFYEDNSQTLSSIASIFFREKKVAMSTQTINLLVERSRGDRQNLNSELRKIESFLISNKTIKIEDILKLTNLAENYDVSELIDSCLAKNKRKKIKILNENNYSVEDCMIIIRTLLTKTKRLVKLCKELLMTNDIDLVVAGCKPAIFWKDKEVVKQQVRSWSFKRAEYLSYEINEIELLIKKNPSNSINILSNFIIEKTSSISN